MVQPKIDKQMKIGIEAQRIFRPKKHGMDIYALELIKAIQKMDTQNDYVVFVKPDADVCLEESENMKIVTVKGVSYLDWEQISLPNAIKKAKIDLMHFTSNTASVNINCPFVLTLHDIIYLENSFSKGSLYQMAGHFYRRWNVPKIVNNAQYIFTVSDFENQRIQQQFSNKQNQVKTIYNAYNQQFKLIEDVKSLEQIREKYCLPNSFIFFLGNQAPKKNMKRVLEAYSQYVTSNALPIDLVVAESSEEDIKSILKEINAENLMKHIVLTGYIPHKELPYLYNLATLFLYPSLRESFGIPIIEAMACGTPVITSNTSAMPEIAHHAAMLVNPAKSDEIANAIQKVLSNEKLYNHLKYSGLSRATEFSWENTAQETIKLYQSI